MSHFKQFRKKEMKKSRIRSHKQMVHANVSDFLIFTWREGSACTIWLLESCTWGKKNKKKL